MLSVTDQKRQKNILKRQYYSAAARVCVRVCVCVWNLPTESRQSNGIQCTELPWRQSRSFCWRASCVFEHQNETAAAWKQHQCDWCAVRTNCFVVDKLLERQTASTMNRRSTDKCWRHCNIDWTPDLSLDDTHIVPDNLQTVGHVIVYRASPSQTRSPAER